jgi:hypothetical protein
MYCNYCHFYQVVCHPISFIRDNISLCKCEDAEYSGLCFNDWRLGDMNVSWDDNSRELIHEKCHKKSSI